MRFVSSSLVIIGGAATRVPLSDVARLLPDFDGKYPGGWRWLEQRLAQADHGDARIWLALAHGEIAALAIDTPKGARHSKLSTFVVGAEHRGFGIGAALIETLRWDWLRRDVVETHVTIDQNDDATQTFFARSNFSLNPWVSIAYGEARHDRLWRWRADEDPLIDAAAFH